MQKNDRSPVELVLGARGHAPWRTSRADRGGSHSCRRMRCRRGLEQKRLVGCERCAIELAGANMHQPWRRSSHCSSLDESVFRRKIGWCRPTTAVEKFLSSQQEKLPRACRHGKTQLTNARVWVLAIFGSRAPIELETPVQRRGSPKSPDSTAGTMIFRRRPGLPVGRNGELVAISLRGLARREFLQRRLLIKKHSQPLLLGGASSSRLRHRRALRRCLIRLSRTSPSRPRATPACFAIAPRRPRVASVPTFCTTTSDMLTGVCAECPSSRPTYMAPPRYSVVAFARTGTPRARRRRRGHRRPGATIASPFADRRVARSACRTCALPEDRRSRTFEASFVAQPRPGGRRASSVALAGSDEVMALATVTAVATASVEATAVALMQVKPQRDASATRTR